MMGYKTAFEMICKSLGIIQKLDHRQIELYYLRRARLEQQHLKHGGGINGFR
jgi:hypothetical protein